MRASSQWAGRAPARAAAGAAIAAVIAAGSWAGAEQLTAYGSPVHPHASPRLTGPGYPPPGGIYKPFTNCPLLNPLMQESVGGNATGCIAGVSRSGSITIGAITTKITRLVAAQ